MIYWFSGTGNSRYVALSISAALRDISRRITDGFINNDDQIIGLVFPIYSWGIPRPVYDFISLLPDSIREVWVVCTCGDETGAAPAMLRKKLEHHNIKLVALWSVIMPNNYVLLPGFDTDSESVEAKKLSKVPARICEIADKIRSESWEIDYYAGSWPRLKSTLIYPVFRRWGIIRRLWHAKSTCIGCGRCAASCPVGNITIHMQRPQWGAACVSCLACYHICPVKAIAYGSMTKGKGQYLCPFKTN